MVKSELVKKIAHELHHLPITQLNEAVNLILETIKDRLSHNGRIEIRGFGSFEARYHKPRRARNPKTGETFITTGRNVVRFKASKLLSNALNANYFSI